MGRTSQTTPRQPHLPQGTGRQRTATESTDLQRERILQAAAALFAAQGYAATTMAQIVRELGVTKPFVYYYFRDKQEIFETLSWRPTVDCFTSMDFPEDDARPARAKVAEGIERLVRATLDHHPCAVFPYREPQVYRPEYVAAQRRLARHFYGKLCALLEQGRRDGDFDFGDTMVTALAACSLPGFLYTWYRPGGRLTQEQTVAELSRLAWRVLGMR
ncbi:TetR/AcrR family transcriptional regulator [Variovorax guangxiensis]|uniref:TetR/AcrR family transcriptional regulator n=1 Tax=Variovorax guangxiensis TaxID=1775474 RepID=A0A502DXC4_9BURK|nr:TetR/AcrR family transcriptional regulator [Variovorax guangxiensis]RZI64369.1 MAG: TetR/AcrR family transcriptional regulator [Variovorax sp.]TPG24690.1 TetR/AcrR family transcriptional regulator [Variovorax ginsengisoli]TPG28941.1 TetR/AcrR family transcriptional regulator [Variovorax guangxiensis]